MDGDGFRTRLAAAGGAVVNGATAAGADVLIYAGGLKEVLACVRA